MTGILCVLRSGGDFRSEHVVRLRDQVAANSPPGTHLIVLTDLMHQCLDLGLEAVPLIHGWPGWWAKVEVFRMIGPALYLDLDVTITGDLTPLLDLAERTGIFACRDFLHPAEHVVNTSVVGWSGDQRRLYRIFDGSAEALMVRYGDPERWQEPGRGWGDQSYVRDHAGPIVAIQDVLPGIVRSIKEPPGDSLPSVLVYHGQPRPWDARCR